jgi:hypothetical protein
MLLVLAEARIGQHLCTHFRETEHFIQFAVGKQACIGGDLATYELDPHTAVKTDTQIVLFGVTHGIPCHCGMLNVPNTANQGLGTNQMPKRTESNGKCGIKISGPEDIFMPIICHVPKTVVIRDIPKSAVWGFPITGLV